MLQLNVKQLFVMVLLAFSLASGVVVAADATADSVLSNLVTRVAVARSAIVGFDVFITGRVLRSRPFEPSEDRRTVAWEMRLAFDDINARRHIAKRDTYEYRDGQTVENPNLNKWQLLVVTPEWQLTKSPSHEQIGISRPSGRRSDIEYFDPRALGLGFCGDIKRGSNVQTILGSYLQWPPQEYSIDTPQAGLTRYVIPNEYRLIVDTDHDDWPVDMLVTSGSKLMTRTEITLVSVNDCWVPGTAKLTCTSETTEMTFQWNSVNIPIPDSYFTPVSIARQYGLKIPARGFTVSLPAGAIQ